MRAFVTSISALVLATLACSRTAPAPTVPGMAAPAGGADRAAAPATILYHVGSFDSRSVVAISEDGAGAAVTLSAAGASASFVTALEGRRVLIAERAADGSLARLIAVGVDGSGRQVVGTAPAGYEGVAKALVSGPIVVAALQRAGGLGVTDLYVFPPGGAAVQLAQGATLSAVGSGRVLYLASAHAAEGSGDARSIALDATADVALGGGDGQDQILQADGVRVLLTIHGAAVRLVGFSGEGAVTLATAGANLRAFALGSGRILYTRDGALASSSLDGTDERVLAPAATPILVAPDGRILFASGGALSSVAPLGGVVRVLDAHAGASVRFARIFGDSVIFTGDGAEWAALRAARLDGSGARVLFEREVTLPIVAGVTSSGHVVFHASYLGQLEGGQVLSAKLDGTETQQIGRDVYSTEGTRSANVPADQDFEALTPSGRVILESEYEGSTFGAQLLVGAPASGAARELTALGSVRFAALIP